MSNNNSNSNNDNDKSKDKKSVVNVLSFLMGIVHTFVRFLPLGLYFFVYLSSALYKDLRAAYLFIGLVINDLVGYLYKKYTKFRPNGACAIFSKIDDKSEPGFLPNPHTEIMSFVSSFFFTDMFYKGGIDAVPFTFLLFMLFVTVWSRISIGCKKMKDVLFNLIFGAIRGILFYMIISKYYLEAHRGVIEKETCDLGFDNYRCDEIKNGTVIIKEGSNREEEDINSDTNDDDDE
jgi:hypothetical protein